jgi:hypothetical protein
MDGGDVRSTIMQDLREILRDAFDPEYCEAGSIKAIHWDAVAEVLSFEGHVECINVWFGVNDDGSDSDILVEYSRHPGGMNPKALWEAP